VFGWNPKSVGEAVDVIESFVDHREADESVDDVRVDVDAGQDAAQEGHAVADGEASYVSRDVAQAVEEEDHAYQEQQVVVTGDHVFRAQVDEWGDVGSRDAFEKRGVAALHCVGVGAGR